MATECEPKGRRDLVDTAFVLSIIVFLATLTYMLVGKTLPSPEVAERATQNVRDFLKLLPATVSFYVLVLSLILGWLCWWMKSYDNLKKRANLEKECYVGSDRVLQDRDWATIVSLRSRAFFLNKKAELILGSIVGLLICGIYIVWFVLPSILVDDRTRLFSNRFIQEFGPTLDELAKGMVWLTIRDDHSKPTTRKTPAVQDIDNLYRLAIEHWAIENIESNAKDSRQVYVVPSNTEGRFLAENKLNDLVMLGMKDNKVVAIANLDAGWDSIDTNKWIEGSEKITELTINGNGDTVIVELDRNSTHFVTKSNDGGWRRIGRQFSFPSHESILHTDVSENGRVGLILGDEGSMVMAVNKGEEWIEMRVTQGQAPKDQSKKQLKGSRFAAGALSSNGKVAMASDTAGGLFVSGEQQRGWELVEAEGAAATEGTHFDKIDLSVAGRIAIASTTNGKVFWSIDSGREWSKRDEIVLEEGETIASLDINASGNTAIVGGSEGTVYMTRDFGETWIRQVLNRDGNSADVEYVALNLDGSVAIVETIGDSVAVWSASSDNWTIKDISDQEYEGRVVRVRIREEGSKSALMVVWYGKAIHRLDDDEEWKLMGKLDLGVLDEVSIWSATNEHVVVVSEGGRVFVARENDSSLWREVDELRMLQRQEPYAVAISGDGSQILVVSDVGRGYFMDDVSGGRWVSTTQLDDHLEREGRLDSESPFDEGMRRVRDLWWSEGAFFMAANGDTMYLRAHDELKQLHDKGPRQIMKILRDATELKDSQLYGHMAEFMGGMHMQHELGTSTESFMADEEVKLLFSRVITLAILFFLIHILVRLYQYVLRLAMFWDSRADAMLAYETFSRGSVVTFDKLVEALGPDGYDFRAFPGRMSPHRGGFVGGGRNVEGGGNVEV